MPTLTLRRFASALSLLLIASSLCGAESSGSSGKSVPSQAAMRRESEDLDRKRPQFEGRLEVQRRWLEKLNALLTAVQPAQPAADFSAILDRVEKGVNQFASTVTNATSGASTPTQSATNTPDPFRTQGDEVFRLIYMLATPIDNAFSSLGNTGMYPSTQQPADVGEREEQELRTRLTNEYYNAQRQVTSDYSTQIGYQGWSTAVDLQNALKSWKTEAFVRQWFKAYKDAMLGAITRERDNTARLVEKSERELKALTDRLAQLDTQMQDSQASLDQTLVKWVMPVFALVVVVLLIIPIFYRDHEAQESILKSGMVVELITIYLLVSSILILGFANKLEKETLSTLLGGISGYVLGRIGQRQTIAALTNPNPGGGGGGGNRGGSGGHNPTGGGDGDKKG